MNSNGNGTHSTKPTLLPKWAVKMSLRIAQITDEPGQYSFVVIVNADGSRKLIPPAKPEELT